MKIAPNIIGSIQKKKKLRIYAFFDLLILQKVNNTKEKM